MGEDSKGWREGLLNDELTAVFGAFGRSVSSGVDVGLGTVRAPDELSELWAKASVGDLCASIEEYPGTQGSLRLCEAIAGVVAAERSLAVGPDRILASHGALDGLCHALAGLPPGSPVLYPVPGFPVSTAIDRANHRPVPLHWALGSPLRDLMSDIHRFVAENRSGDIGVILNFPANPSGLTPSVGEWDELTRLVAHERLHVVFDDVYGFLDRCPRPTEALLESGAVIVDSISKRLGAPGLRLGWILAREDQMPAMRSSMARTSVGVARPVMTMGAAALELYVSEDVRSALLDEIRRRREQLHDRLTSSLSSQLVTTDSGLYASLVLSGGFSSVKVASTLAVDGLLVTPSESIGLDRPRHDSIPFIRLCLGGYEDFGEVAEILNANESVLIQRHG